MTEEEVQKAEAIVGEWFWQPDSWHRKSVVRYYESAPIQPDVLQLVIAYLKQQETDRLFILNKELQLGETWKATDAWFQTSPSDKWAGTESTKIRIYQSFKPKSDESDGPYTVENGCKYLVTHEFHWDVAEVPTLPASSSGVQYALQGVTRDRDTGLYSCVVEKRETVQQDVADYGTSETVFESRSEEQHLGVRQDKVGDTGKKASASAGTIVRRRIVKNADCTSDVQNETIVEKPVPDSTHEYRKTLRGTVETVVDRNQKDALNNVNLAIGETRRSEQTEGGRWNNTTVKATAAAAGEVATDCRQTVFEHQHVSTENVATKPEDLEAEAASGGVVHRKTVRATEEGTFDVTDTVTTEKAVSGATVERRKTLRGTVETVVDRNQEDALDNNNLAIGETRRSEQTEGGLWNNTTVKATAAAAGEVATDCRQTVFEHQHVSTENVATKPDSVEATAATNGIVHRKTIRATEEGTFDVTDTVTTEKAVSGATVELRKTLRGTVETVVDRNQDKALDDNNLAIGETRRSEKTEGGLWNNTTVKATAEAAGVIQQSCAKTSSVHTDDTIENVAQKPNNIEQDATVNVERQKTVTMTEAGTFDVRTRTTTYGQTTTVAKSNTALRKEVTTTVANNPSLNPEATAGRASASPNDHGSATTSVTEVQLIAKDTGWKEWESEHKTANGTYKYKNGIRIFRNLADVPSVADVSGTDCKISVSINDFGLFDGSMSYTTLLSWTQDSSGSGAYGGIKNGTITFYEYMVDGSHKRFRRTCTAPVTVYYGKGNEGAEAVASANAILIPGVRLPSGTYITGAPTFGEWQAD